MKITRIGQYRWHVVTMKKIFALTKLQNGQWGIAIVPKDEDVASCKIEKDFPTLEDGLIWLAEL